MTEINCTIETGATPENTKETIVEIDPIAGIENCENIMKEIDHTVGIDSKITMIEVGPITEMIGAEIGITCEIIMKETNLGMTMKETDPTLEIDHMTDVV